MSRQFPAAPPAPSTPLVPPGAAAPSQTLLDRTGTWLERNKNLVILGTAVAVSAGVGYYLYSNSSSAPGSGGDGASTSSKKSKKKKNSKKSKFIPGEGTDGPLLEEVKPAPAPAEPKKEAVAPEEEDLFSDVPQGEALAASSETQRNELGAKLKDKGNKMYAKKNYEKAVECYTKAIEVSVKRDPVFFSNRAACYNNFKPPQYEKVVDDCNEALALDKTYAKALRRRAGALEHLDRLEEAIRDFTATTVIEAFQDRVSAEGMERALVNLVAKRWSADKEKRENTMPSHSFISQYISAFRPRAKPALPENPSQGDRTLDLAFDALEAQDYAHALSFNNEALEQGVSTKESQAEAHTLRGTFRFLMNDPKRAAEDLEKSISIHPTPIAWTKLAAVRMELADKVKAFGDFESAIQLNPDDPDVYYHRAQVYFISEEWQQAMKDYEKSIQLDNTFIFAYIQYAMCQYKLGNKAGTYATFRKILKQFPDRSESYNYYGEVLSEEESYPEAIERFDRAIEIEKKKPKPNVIAMVNKAYTLTKWKQDHEAAIKLCKEAFEIDQAHDVAAATLGHLILRQGQMEEATVWFQKAYDLARSEHEALAVLQYLEATKAQLSFLKTYPELAYRLTTPPEGLMQ